MAITLQVLQNYHSTDKMIFSTLMFTLFRCPSESLLVMAFWHSLESLKFGNLLCRLLSCPDTILNRIADEAVICLSCLHSKILPPPDIDIPLTAITMGETLSIKLLLARKYSLISAIKFHLNNVCAYVFTDILVQVLPLKRAVLNFPIRIPGFPHPTFGHLTVIPRSLDYVIPFEAYNIHAPVDDRTLFLTFSKGYPVTEDEVIELFNSCYGVCVEEVSMDIESSSPSSSITNHRLFARLVVNDISIIDQILSQGPVAKYRINGKHVWARKFERRSSEYQV